MIIYIISTARLSKVRDRPLIIGRGGGGYKTVGGGGQVKVHPQKKGGGSFGHAERGGGTRSLRIMHPIQNSYGKSMKFGTVVPCTMYNRLL